ncbi:hypothetical protein NT2_01_05530 [Caenibius tardaugens NBRC 16725]|uniref:Uncharacterized protein n=1 Tax=Caenibius tardaugens NBRC 16725 TaxID=1219035 RepID=U2ZQX8_9SPHN|nr:hypothetical protein [Caenibius tardaugens]AZI37001.1 aminoglycoside phosphotransferase [Caenibius tardaugens NBRC 16725]GAD47779.1 hypothetical protein NT2_01_05530 [Caenibius tardaugens NBRC 16725]
MTEPSRGLRPQVPTMANLLRTVRDYLDSHAGQPGNRFQAQVASYLLAICEREIAYRGPMLDDGAQLCAAIRDGAHDACWDDLITRLLDETVVAVEVTRPELLDPMHRAIP